MKVVLFYCGFCLLLVNCKTTKMPVDETPSPASPSIESSVTQQAQSIVDSNRTGRLNGTWLLTKMPGNDNDWSRVPELNLDLQEGTFTGNTGCNSMSGRFRVSNEEVSFDDEIVMTKMACQGRYNEQAFLSNLLRINNFIITDSALQLRQLDTVKLVFRRKPV